MKISIRGTSNALKRLFSRSASMRDFSQKRRVLTGARMTRLPLEKRSRLLWEIERRMAGDPHFFENLDELRFDKLRLFGFEGQNVVIKNLSTKFNTDAEGGDYQRYAKFNREYRSAVRKGLFAPTRYKLVKISPYGVVRAVQWHGEVKKPWSFLVMEGVKAADIHDDPVLRRSYEEAIAEMKSHIDVLRRKSAYPLIGIPQHGLGDTIPLGNTRPDKPEKGVWLIALPHDYG